MQRLLGTLVREGAALGAADIDALEQITPAKNACMVEQAELAAQRGRFLANLSYSDSNEGLQSFLTASGNPPELVAALDTLGECAQKCQQHNRENGRLILAKQQQTQNALNILRQNGSAGPTYSGQGLADSSDDSRTLGKA